MASIIGYGVSDTLKSIFEGLKHTEYMGKPKFYASDINNLAQHIVCRNYGSLCYELCYLCWAILHANKVQLNQHKLLYFMYTHNFSSKNEFKLIFSDCKKISDQSAFMPEKNTLTRTEKSLLIHTDLKTFELGFNRGGIVSLMFEFLSNIEPELCGYLESELEQANEKKIDEVSKHILHRIYLYLAEHLPRAQILKRHRNLEEWLNDTGMSADKINDQTIIDYWEFASSDSEKEGYVLYESVVNDVLDGLSAYKIVATQHAAYFAASIGSDFDAGEVDPNKIQNQLEINNAFKIDIHAFSKAPKCLTQEQASSLNLLVMQHTFIQTFSLSMMRHQIFSPWQNKLVNAKRKSHQHVLNKLAEPELNNYSELLEMLIKIKSQLEFSLDCLSFLILEVDAALGCSIIIESIAEPYRKEIAIWFAQQLNEHNTLKEPAKRANYKLILQQAQLKFPALKARMSELKSAFAKNKKDGFNEAVQLNEVEKYAHSITGCEQLRNILTSYIPKVEEILKKPPPHEKSVSVFETDLHIFTQRFIDLYGGNHVN